MAATQARPAEPAAGSAGLDTLLTDAALGPVRRMMPGRATIKLAAKLAVRPDKVARRGAGLAAELTKIAVGRSDVEVPAKGPPLQGRRVDAEPRLPPHRPELPGDRSRRSTR